jgi:hypothetical protein
MAKQKELRFYEMVDGTLLVYDAPYRDRSLSVSICRPDDLRYYLKTFHTRKVWG